jgi:hypothetical protein
LQDKSGVAAKFNADLKNCLPNTLSIAFEKGGTILGCGTCLHNRKNDEPQVCKFSSLSDLYLLVGEIKTVLTF